MVLREGPTGPVVAPAAAALSMQMGGGGDGGRPFKNVKQPMRTYRKPRAPGGDSLLLNDARQEPHRRGCPANIGAASDVLDTAARGQHYPANPSTQ